MPHQQAEGAPYGCGPNGTNEIVGNGRPWEQEPRGDPDDPEQGGGDDDSSEARDHVFNEGPCQGTDVAANDEGSDASQSDSYCSDTDQDDDTEGGEETEDEEDDNEDEVFTVQIPVPYI